MKRRPSIPFIVQPSRGRTYGLAWALLLAGAVLACGPNTPQGGSDRADTNSATSGDAMTDKPPSDLKDPAQAAFPLEEVVKIPGPGGAIPRSFSFTQSDGSLVYLDSADDSLTRQLYARAIESDGSLGEPVEVVKPPGEGETEENLTLEEKLRRERARERGLGITRYAWSETGNRLLIPIRGALYGQDGIDGSLVPLFEGDQPAIDARMSRDGRRLAFVQGGEIFAIDLPETLADLAEPPAPKQLTSGAAEQGKTHGLAEYIAQEEMDRSHGYWWSRDGAKLAFAEVDESHIPTYRIVHQGKDGTGEGAQEDHGYPFAGAQNARIRLAVLDVGPTGSPLSPKNPRYMELKIPNADGTVETEDLYLARVHWMPSGELWAQVENREQSRLDLVRFDLQTGKSEVLLSETSDVWINLHHMMWPLDEQEPGSELEGAFLWGSERSGFRHLELRNRDGALIRALTESGEGTGNGGDDGWLVTGIVEVDEDSGTVYFGATKEGPLERHLYSVPLAGGPIKRISQEPGSHGVRIDHGFSRYLDIHSDINGAYAIELRSLADGSSLAKLHDPQGADKDPRIEQLGLQPPELVTVETRDGVTLHGALYRPDGEGPFPTIVSVYGGPHAQRVTNSWGLTADTRSQYLRSLGFAVFKLDNRGSANRGLAFEGAIRHDMGNLEVQDQVDGVNWLVEQGIADPERVGIYGWSYGGYMSAMALARAPETFSVGVAGAPVSHWDGYDTHYTERYMGTPQSNPEGYEASAVMSHVKDMTGHLMIVHGLIDENVHFRHSARLINSLIKNRKNYDLLLFPDERHVPRGPEDRVYMEEHVRDYFLEHLSPR